jgi:hypothetical protein
VFTSTFLGLLCYLEMDPEEELKPENLNPEQ